MINTTVARSVRNWGDEAVRQRWRIAALLPVAGWPLSLVTAAVSVLRGLLPVGFAVFISLALGEMPAAIGQGARSEPARALLTWLALATCALVGRQLMEPVQTMLGEILARRVDGAMRDRLIAASLSRTDLAALEDPKVLDLLEEASRELDFAFRTPGAAYAGLLALLARYVQMAGFCVVLGVMFSWAAAAAIAVTAILFRIGQRGGLRRYARVIREVTPIRREAAYVRDVATGDQAAKELRVFGLTGWLARRYRSVQMRALMPVWRARRRIYLAPYLGYLAVGLVAGGLVFAGLGGAAARGEVSITGLSLAAQAVLAVIRLGDFYPESDTQTQYGMNAADAIARFEQVVAGAPEAPPPRAPVAPAPVAATGPPRIEFRGLTFRYPGADRPVFDRLDLTLEPGLCTALVGVNGAGKTTLVKLLARLYQPESGAILADGRDIGEPPIEEWWRRLAVVFQDFTRYELTARANIGFGAVEALDDDDAIRAAAREAGVWPALSRLPEGLDTTLSRHYPGGVDLSGGQWQRIALARAMLALGRGASVLILDEPTSALDIRTEAEFFARFRDLTRGRTGLLISHRFSSVRCADRIVVLDGGRVVESGSHDELIALDGRYARLFRLQAERFASEGGLDAAPDR